MTDDAVAPPAPQPPDGAAGGSWARRHRAALLLAGGGVVLLLAAYVAALVHVGPGVPRGTTVAGVTIGGLSQAAAVEVLDHAVSTGEQPLDVTVDGQPRTLTPETAGLSLDAPATVAAAGQRSLNPVTLVQQLLGQDVPPVVDVDQARLDRTLDQLARGVDHPVRQGRVYYEGTTPVAVEPRPGRALDREAAAALVTEAYLRQEHPVALPVVEVAPEVTAEEVHRVAEGDAVVAVSAPVTLEVRGDGEVEVTPEELAGVLVFRPDGSRLVPHVATPRLRAELADQLAAVERPAVDATFDVSSGRPVVVPSSSGLGIDDDALTSGVTAAIATTSDRVAQLHRVRTQPELTTREAKALGITEVVSSYNQWFPYAEYRVTNIGVAARNMDGTVILPGETYSMNGVVGERTPENGFVKGYVIQDGRLVEDYGGAVSTITTATWHAAFYAGMTRLEQRAHSFWISRYTAGLEATVSWGSLDLRWRNDTPYGVLVTTSMTNESVTVTLWSTKYWDISAEFGPRTHVRPYAVVYDASPTCVEQYGVDGFDITVTRVWSRHGQVVRREPIHTSYNPEDTVICAPEPRPSPSPTKAGSKPSPSPTQPSPSPSPTKTH